MQALFLNLLLQVLLKTCTSVMLMHILLQVAVLSQVMLQVAR